MTLLWNKTHIILWVKYVRYYVYIDKNLIKKLAATYSEINFNIDFVEFSVQKNCGNINNIRFEPRNEIMCDNEKKRKSTRKSKSVGVDAGTSCNVITEKKYINITDITDIKNMNFYHNLIEKLNKVFSNKSREDKKIITLEGRIINLRTPENINEKIFLINNSYVWYNDNMCDTNINFLSNMCEKIKVIGYNINENKMRGYNILKAIAIYIE